MGRGCRGVFKDREGVVGGKTWGGGGEGHKEWRTWRYMLEGGGNVNAVQLVISQVHGTRKSCLSRVV